MIAAKSTALVIPPTPSWPASDPAMAPQSLRGGALRLGGGSGALLRFLFRLGFLRIVVDPRLHQTGLGQHLVDAVRTHRTLAQPGLRHLEVELDAIGMIRRQQRIVEADLLDEAAVARAARIRDHDVVMGAFLGAAASQTNAKSHGFFLVVEGLNYRRGNMPGGKPPGMPPMPGIVGMRPPLPIFFI